MKCEVDIIARNNSDEDDMYKKMLIPTDGSEFSSAVALAGIKFGKQINAEIVGIFVAPEFQHPIYVEVLPSDYPSNQQYQESMRDAGEAYLKNIQDAAQAAELKYSGLIVFSDSTADKIAQTAEEEHCDLIFMGSHGRSGWVQLLLGSVTTRLLAICETPVLVQRMKKPGK